MIVNVEFFYSRDIGDSSNYGRNMKRFELFGDGLRVLAYGAPGGWDWSLWCGKLKVCDNPTCEQIETILKALGK